MFADGAGISLSLHVPASSEGERRGLGERINYRYTEQMRLVVVYSTIRTRMSVGGLG